MFYQKTKNTEHLYWMSFLQQVIFAAVMTSYTSHGRTATNQVDQGKRAGVL